MSPNYANAKELAQQSVAYIFRYTGYDNAAPAEKARPGDQLKLSGDVDARRSRDDYNVAGDASGRVTPFKPSTNIKNDGHFDFATEKRTQFGQYDSVTPTPAQPPKDNLGPNDGTMYQLKSEVQV